MAGWSFYVFKGLKNGLWFEQHPRATAEGTIINSAVPVVGKVADVIERKGQ